MNKIDLTHGFKSSGRTTFHFIPTKKSREVCRDRERETLAIIHNKCTHSNIASSLKSRLLGVVLFLHLMLHSKQHKRNLHLIQLPTGEVKALSNKTDYAHIKRHQCINLLNVSTLYHCCTPNVHK